VREAHACEPSSGWTDRRGSDEGGGPSEAVEEARVGQELPRGKGKVPVGEGLRVGKGEGRQAPPLAASALHRRHDRAAVGPGRAWRLERRHRHRARRRLHVWTGLKTAELGYERSRAVELSRRLENQREELADEYAGLLRTEYLEEESARRLGLVAPSAGQVVDLRRKQLAAAPRGYRR